MAMNGQEDSGLLREDLVARLFKGLSDPIRVAVLERLREREMSVGELVEA
jgi:DNA-binding transcriptional ArsR family regulator